MTVRRIVYAAWLLASTTTPGFAGVVNPDISVIGQPFARWTDDQSDPARKRPTLNLGEVEGVFDAYLNPYARGTFILAIDDEGIEVEEGYFQLLRGLPGGLALKGGVYLAGFGKMNPSHPHTLPFAEPFRVLPAYLPGDESFRETGVSVSSRIPVPGDFSLTASADWLQGDSFRRERDPTGAGNDPFTTGLEDPDRAGEPRPAVLGRLSGFGGLGDRSGYELGLSATAGTNNVAARTRTRVFGADAKVKLWTSPSAYLLVQGEALHLARDEAAWDSTAAAYARTKVTPSGGYLFADYNWNTRYNVGAGFERFQDPSSSETWNTALKVFAGYALMEETTAFRLDWDHFSPATPEGAEAPPDVNTITLRVIFSMGPHKAHQF